MSAASADRPADFVAGNVFDKYRTGNPLYRRLMAGFLDACAELLAEVRAAQVVEVGCGPGDLANALAARVGWLGSCRYVGVDLAVEEVASARRTRFGARFAAASAYRLPLADRAADCVVACEVFEHLDAPTTALAEVERVCDGHLLLSVPWEPVWRLLNVARGRYLGQLGNTPGHLQHYSRRTIRRLVATRFEILAERHPLPWTVLLARRRDGGCR